MEVDFLLRARRLIESREPAKLDFSVLKAALAARDRATSREKEKNGGLETHEEEALVELLVAGPDWREAVSVQQGCFSRADVGRKRNDL